MKIISFKVKEEIYVKMQIEANKYGLSISAWIRMVILKALANENNNN